MWYSYRRTKNEDGLGLLKEDDMSTAIDIADTPSCELTVAYSDAERESALADLLEISTGDIDKDDYGEHDFLVHTADEDGAYLVLTDEEADAKWREEVENLLMDCGIDGLDIDVSDFVSDEYCEDSVEEYYHYEANDMDSEDLAKELLDAEEIELSDTSIFRLKSKDELGLDDDDEIDSEDPDSYEIVCYHSTLVDKYMEWRRNSEDFVQTYWELGLGDGIDEELRYYIRQHHSFPSWFDFDTLVDHCMDDRGAALSGYDGDEREQEINGRLYYIYRIA
jgi:hypothetical protein